MKTASRVLVFYFLMWVFIAILGGGLQSAVEQGVLTEEPFLGFLPQLAPGIAGLITMLIFLKGDTLRITFYDPTMPPLHYLWLVLASFGLGLIPFVAGQLFFEDVVGLPITVLVVLKMIIGAVGEEIGWRGYLSRYLSDRVSGLWATIIVGALWTTMHIHLFEGGPLFMLFAMMGFVGQSALMLVLLGGYQHNVSGATLFHVGINLSVSLSLSLILPAFSLPFMAIYGITYLLFGLGTMMIRRETFLKVSAMGVR